VWVRLGMVTVTLLIASIVPETLIVEGYGEPFPLYGQSIRYLPQLPLQPGPSEYHRVLCQYSVLH